ncbi:MAG TPA: cyclic nucleotide-binding domain-containing protein [Abditibacteriaceae bacterium]|jgi:CRP-like cAMP-binding protein
MSYKTRAASLAQCRRALASLPFLGELKTTDMETLCRLSRVRDYCAGSTLFYEDDEPDAVYFLESGGVEVFKSDGNGKKLPLAILRDSGVVGEMGLLSSAPRSASVRTLGPVRVVVIASHDVNTALEDGSIAAYRLVLGLARVVSQRLAVADQKLFEMCQNDSSGSAMKQYAALNQEFSRTE